MTEDEVRQYLDSLTPEQREFLTFKFKRDSVCAGNFAHIANEDQRSAAIKEAEASARYAEEAAAGVHGVVALAEQVKFDLFWMEHCVDPRTPEEIEAAQRAADKKNRNAAAQARRYAAMSPEMKAVKQRKNALRKAEKFLTKLIADEAKHRLRSGPVGTELADRCRDVHIPNAMESVDRCRQRLAESEKVLTDSGSPTAANELAQGGH